MKVGSETKSLRCDYIEFPHHSKKSLKKECGTEVLKKVKTGSKYRLVPRKTDVYDGKLWHEWMRKNGIPFLEVPENLLFMLNIDWFQPFDHTQYSCGVIYIVIQNLPRNVRFKMENVIIVSTIPGPKEPNYYQLNNYLCPMVDELKKLWQGILFKTPHSFLKTTVIRAALCYLSSDLPATRKLCGFYGYNATYGCSKCMKIFPHIDKSVDYSGFNRDNWNLRIHAQHLLIADCAKNATTQAEREHHEHKAGVRYTELLQLQYLDLARCHLIDPMHNLFLGTSKRMINLWKARGYLSDTMCEKLQRKMDLIVPPAYTGRLPSKVEAGFAGFTAEQFMLWTTLYSPFVLRDFLPENLYSHWCLFSKACSILCKSCIKKDEVKTADKLLLEFCVGVETLYGYQACIYIAI